jgi:hypothetical protein
MTTMLSDVAAAHATELRALLEDGVLTAAGTIEIAPGVFGYADETARRVLDTLDHLQSARATDPAAWTALERDIEQLYRSVRRHV